MIISFNYTDSCDVMVDLETLATSANATYLTFGAIKFNRFGNIASLFSSYPTAEEIQQKLDCYYARIDFDDMKTRGFVVQQGAVEWWLKQKPEAKAEAFNPNGRVKIDTALDDFYLWYGNAFACWSHGASFDAKLIEDAYSIMKRKAPWFFTESRCTRTMFDTFGLDGKRQKELRGVNHHHALFDCFDQILMLQGCFNYLRNFQQQGLAA